MHLDELISSYSLTVTFGGSLILLILVFISLGLKKLTPILKKTLFISIVFVVLTVTFFLAGSTIYLNSVSVSGGPVHYHADIEIWNCGHEVDLKNPVGISNKIGTSTFHEHNDKRIHLEGVVVAEKDASLGRFLDVIGGKVSSNSLSIPTNEGQIDLVLGQTCSSSQTGVLQVFVYKTIRDTYYQQKVMDPQSYIISAQTNVPPGDCIIIEFDSPKDKTDKLCLSYRVAEKTGKLKGEVRYGN